MVGQVADDAAITADRNSKKAVFKSCVRLISCVSKMSNAEDLDIVMTMYNLLECNESYSKTSASLW